MTMRRTAIFICCLTMLASACAEKARLPVKSLAITKSDGSTVSVEAEIAVKTEDRNRGFMERREIPDGTGMLFVFDRDQRLSFWMKNTPTPLSIAYIDSQGTIRDIFNMTPYSLSNIESTVSVRYALEVPQGWFDRAGVAVGDRVAIPENIGF